MFCENCGKEIPEDSSFCPECGTRVKQLDEETIQEQFKTNNKKKRYLLSGIGIIIFLLILSIVFVNSGNSGKSDDNSFFSSLFDSPKTKSVKKLRKFIEEGNADGIYEMCIMPYEIEEDDEEDYFGQFVDKYLNGCEVTETESGCDLTKGKNTFHLMYADNEKFHANDFFMKYTVKYTSYIGENNFRPILNGDAGSSNSPASNGTVLITNHILKTDSTTLEYDLILGGEEYGDGMKLLPDVKLKVNFDENFKPKSIGSVTNFSSGDTYDGEWAKIDGNIIYLNRYYVSETFAQELAQTGVDFFNRVTSYFFNGYTAEDYSSFCSANSDIMESSESLREEYEASFFVLQRLKNNDFYDVYDSVNYVADSWNYPTEFNYSDGQFSIDITAHADVYAGEYVEISNDPITITCVFEPREDGFKLVDIV